MGSQGEKPFALQIQNPPLKRGGRGGSPTNVAIKVGIMANKQNKMGQFLKIRTLILGLLFVGAIALTGCRGIIAAHTNRQPQLVFASPSDPATFNYPLNTSAYSVFGLINEGLITQNGETAELEPALAESWEISDDNLRITFTLRAGLRWSDGEPLTAEDVVFTYKDVYLNPKVPTGIKDILRVGDSFPEVRALDARRVQFSVPRPFAPFLRYAGGISILPKHALEASINTTNSSGDLLFLSTWGTNTDPREIVGAGPYRMVRYVPGQRVVFERNPYYWKEDEAGNPQPYIESIVTRTIESDETQSVAFRSGELDSLGVQPEVFSLLKREEERGGYTIYNGGPAPDSRFVGFNLSTATNAAGKPFVDPVISSWFNRQGFRQAVAYALDREKMKNNIYRGLGEVQHSPIAVDNPFYRSPEQGLRAYEYNPERAKALLLENGFRYNDNNRLEDEKGNLVRFQMLVKSEEKVRVDAAVQVQQDLDAIGIQADLQVVNFNTVLQKLQDRDWQVYVGGFGGGTIEPHSGFNIWYSGGTLHQFNQGPMPGEEPIQNWQVSDWEKEIDTLFIAGVGELDEAKRKEIYGEFQQIVAEQVPFIYLVNAFSLQAVRDRIENIRFTALGGAFWNLHELELKAN